MTGAAPAAESRRIPRRARFRSPGSLERRGIRGHGEQQGNCGEHHAGGEGEPRGQSQKPQQVFHARLPLGVLGGIGDPEAAPRAARRWQRAEQFWQSEGRRLDAPADGLYSPAMSRRIAIVEDDPTIRANYAEALRKHGFEVAAYAERAEALAAMSARLPDLALIDIGLGADIDGGFTLCRAVPARGACRAAAGRGGAPGARRARARPEALQRHVARHRCGAHAHGILYGARAVQVSGAREEPRAADARSEPGGRRRHHHLPRQAHPQEIPRRRRALRCDRHRLWHGLPVEVMRRVRFSLRAKLALTALLLLAMPWAGTLYVNEVERFLLEGQEQSLLATARTVATVLHERPQLLASASGHDDEVDAILLGLQQASSRVWVVDRGYQVVALAGRLKRVTEAAAEAPWWQPLVGWFIERPTEDFTESLPENVLATSRDIAAAMQGTPATLVRRTQDGRAVVMSAAHPIWSGDEVVGAVVVEETTNPIVSLKTAALERLLLLTIAVFAGAAALLIAFASRLSLRIRRLRDEAESAIDARGRITRLAAGSGASDEIGDLSRSFSAVLARLAQHHAYLESMAGRHSHELPPPIAVVRSSLQNLKLAPGGSEARRSIERAEEGLSRLNRILERMMEASRLEQSLSSVERERYDLVGVVRGCVEGYRVAYPRIAFAVELPRQSLQVEGSPDLAAQLLDKLVENAVDFCRGAEPVRIELTEAGGAAVLSVVNKGRPLPAEFRARLFESMISVREGPQTAAPHLGIGLYVARLIAEYHGGSTDAANLPAGDGVAVTVRIPLAWK